MDSDSDLMYVTASEGDEEFPSPPRRRCRRRRPRGCRAGLRVQRQRLAAARATADATLPAAAHAELRAENKRLKEQLDESTRKCNELRKRVWTLLDEARTRNRQPPPSAPNRQTPALHLTLVDRRTKLKLAGRNPGGSMTPVATSRDDAGTTTTASLVRRPRLLRALRSKNRYWIGWWRCTP